MEYIHVANNFWIKIMEHSADITSELLKKDYESYQKITNMVTKIQMDLKINNEIGVYFGIDTRNGNTLPERKDQIEIIISPLFKKASVALMLAIYDAHFNYIPKNWCVVKYKFWQPSSLQDMTINHQDVSHSNKEGDIIEITKDDFEYFPFTENNKLSIIVFVNDDVAKYMIKKEHVEHGINREMWLPINTSIYMMLDSAIGEFNLLNTLNNMEIYLKSEHTEIDRHPLEHLTQTIQMINNNPLSNIHSCARCEYNNTQTKLKVCRCKKVYYCDEICQRAHRSIHKKNCK